MMLRGLEKVFVYRWAILGLLLGGMLAGRVFSQHLYDDAYIHARLADHTLAWGLPIFNAGEIFKVGSSSGFVLLIAALGYFVDLILAIRIIEFVAVSLCVGALFHLAANAGAGVSSGTRGLAVVGAIPYLLLAGLGGMETPVACMLLVFSAVAFQRRRYAWALCWISLAVWFRIETLLLWVGALCIATRGSQKAFIGGWPLLLLVAFDLHFFGTLMPHAAKVKSVAYGFPWLDAVRNALSFGQPYGAWSALLGLLLLLVWGCSLVLALRSRDVFEPSFAFLTLSVGILLAWLVGRTVIFQWYYCLLVLPFCAAVLLEEGFPALSPICASFFKGANLLVLALFFLFGYKSLGPVFGKKDSPGMNFRVSRYMDIGRALYTQCPSCVLVTSEIGALGYSFKGRVYDAFGLGDPEAVRFHPMKVPQERQGFHIGAIPPAYVRLRSPDFVVSMPVFSMALRASGELRHYVAYDCPLYPDSSVAIFGDRQIEVYSKKVLPPMALREMGCKPA